MITMAQQPENIFARMSAKPIIPKVDPHATLTVPIGPPPPTPDLPISMSAGPAPDVSTGMAAPNVNSPASLPGIKARAEDRLMADYKKDADPYGSPDNHPGFFGKFLHGLNVATGGVNRRQFEEQGLENRLTDLSKIESAEGLRGANTASTEEKTREMPGESAARIRLENAQADKDSNPQAKPVFKEYSGPDNARQWFQIGQQPEGWQAYERPSAGSHTAFDQWSSDPTKYQDFVKSMDEIKAQVAAEHPGQAKNASFMNIYAAQRFLQMAYSHNPALLPVASQMIGKLLNLTPEQTKMMGDVPEDQPLSPETGNPIGTSMPEAPTSGTRGQAQTAARVLTEMPRIRTEVTNAAAHLGPVQGREAMGFLLGTVGSTGNPALDRQLAELRGDLTFTGSAAAKFHLNSVRAMEVYDKMIDAGKNTSQAIQGTLDSVESWAKTAQHQERGYGETGNERHPESSSPKRYELNGKEIVPRDGKWVYKDTGKAVE